MPPYSSRKMPRISGWQPSWRRLWTSWRQLQAPAALCWIPYTSSSSRPMSDPGAAFLPEPSGTLLRLGCILIEHDCRLLARPLSCSLTDAIQYEAGAVQMQHAAQASQSLLDRALEHHPGAAGCIWTYITSICSAELLAKHPAASFFARLQWEWCLHDPCSQCYHIFPIVTLARLQAHSQHKLL